MTQHIPPANELPSTRTLLRSTALAAAIATAILVTIVLPAEYAIDPTGIGGVLGLQEMGETKATLEQEAKADASPRMPAAAPCPPAVAPAPPAPSQGSAAVTAAPALTHVTRVTLKPGEGKEVKLTMRAGARVTFTWSTDQGVVNYDLHSDNPTTGGYHGYGKGKGARTHDGVLVAAFDGMHGWFWRNRGSAALTVTLETTGEYEEIKELK